MTDKVNINETTQNADGALITDLITVAAGIVTVPPEAVDAAFDAIGINQKEYKRQQKAVSDATVSLLSMVGDKAVDAMVDDKDLSLVTTTFRMGHDEVSAKITREAQIHDRFNPSNPPKTVHGDMSVKIKTKTNASAIKALTQNIRALGAAKLGK